MQGMVFRLEEADCLALDAIPATKKYSQPSIFLFMAKFDLEVYC